MFYKVLTVCVLEPTTQADYTLGISQQDFISLSQALFDLCCQTGCVQENTASDFGVVTVEPVTYDVNWGHTGSHVIGVHGNAPYFPTWLYFQVQCLMAVAHDFSHGFFQIPFTGADQQQVIHVA